MAMAAGSFLQVVKYKELSYTDCADLWPRITYDDINEYFINKLGHDKRKMEAYKSMEAYHYVKSGKVHNITIATVNNKVVLRGVVSPSQRSGMVYTCWVAAEHDGEIVDASCSCMAGLGEVCSHCAAICFTVEATHRENSQLPAPTDLPCQWLAPRLKQIPPQQARQLDYRRPRWWSAKRNRNATEDSTIEFPDDKFEAFVSQIRTVAPEARLFTLIDINQAAATQPSTQTQASGDFIISPTSPLSSLNICVELDNIKISRRDAEEIEKLTRLQRKSPAWFAHRKGRITASIFKDVCASKQVKVSSLLQKNFCSQNIRSPAIYYGIENEARAKDSLFALLSQHHANGRIEDCGLMISPRYPYLGCSPDGVYYCDCHEPALVEVKCLYTMRDADPTTLAENGQNQKDFCLTRDGTLKQSHRYYYQVQAQLHLNLVDSKRCYFFLFVERGGHLVEVERDEEFMMCHESSVRAFFTDIVLPRLVSGF
ncbi:uncharacterized protein LOC135395422 [Ornithodoros turicata]|uniref:uncharacterized protein LOC135395422 n=1 Tax=Ornithodoros turicata TaxID=34597 RepID=UPI003139A0EA